MNCINCGEYLAEPFYTNIRNTFALCKHCHTRWARVRDATAHYTRYELPTAFVPWPKAVVFSDWSVVHVGC